VTSRKKIYFSITSMEVVCQTQTEMSLAPPLSSHYIVSMYHIILQVLGRKPMDEKSGRMNLYKGEWACSEEKRNNL
jgi:hypothetical protein